MYLNELIETLEKYPREQVVAKGFNSAHSYRGDYAQLAFEPADNVTVGEMLDCARKAFGKTYRGYKGGEYKMGEYTECYIANYGECGEEIGKLLMSYMLGDV